MRNYLKPEYCEIKKIYRDINTAYEALYNMMYTLNLNRFDRNCEILKTNSGRILYIEHTGKTYAVANN